MGGCPARSSPIAVSSAWKPTLLRTFSRLFFFDLCGRAKNEVRGTKFRTIWGKVTRPHGKG